MVYLSSYSQILMLLNPTSQAKSFHPMLTNNQALFSGWTATGHHLWQVSPHLVLHVP
jgi:hypothetical protein